MNEEKKRISSDTPTIFEEQATPIIKKNGGATQLIRFWVCSSMVTSSNSLRAIGDLYDC